MLQVLLCAWAYARTWLIHGVHKLWRGPIRILRRCQAAFPGIVFRNRTVTRHARKVVSPAKGAKDRASRNPILTRTLKHGWTIPV